MIFFDTIDQLCFLRRMVYFSLLSDDSFLIYTPSRIVERIGLVGLVVGDASLS
jgi:hypothetical protein